MLLAGQKKENNDDEVCGNSCIVVSTVWVFIQHPDPAEYLRLVVEDETTGAVLPTLGIFSTKSENRGKCQQN